MSWFLIAIIAPFLYSLTNHIDKILLDKYFKSGGVGTLILFSALLSVLAIPLIIWNDPTILDVSLLNVAILSLVGVFNIMILWCYLLALQQDEASVTIVFYQLVPVLGLVLGYFILDETLNQMQLIAMSIIILGTSIIAFEIDIDNNFKLRKLTALYMIAASTFWALESVIFKAVAIEINVWRSLFWEHVVLVLVGIIIFIANAKYRSHFMEAIRTNSKVILGMNIANEVLYISGNIVVAFAFMLAPIALILLAESFQPIFVLLIGIILTIFFPKLSKEKIHAKHIWQKLLAITITGIGTYILLYIA